MGGNKWSFSSGGVLTVTGGISPDITSNSGSSLTIDSGTTGALNFGTGSNAKTITIGNVTGATSVRVNAGSGGGAFVSSAGLTLNPYGTSAGNTTGIRFAELAANGSNYVGFKANDSLVGNVTWVLPVADGTNGQVLSTDGASSLFWASPGACATCFTNGGNTFAATADLGTNDANTLNFRTNSTTKVTILSGGNVGIGDTTPAALLTVGSGDKFQVDTNGNILKINNVTTSFPASQGAASTVLTNDGAGNLSWASLGSSPTTLNSITAAAGTSSIGNTNYNIAWNWSLTGVTNGLDISENVASVGTGYLMRVGTITASTAKPFSIGARGTTILDTTATGGITLGDSATLNTPVTIQSGTGAINIGTDAVAHTITLGNVTGATSLVLNAGTGNIDVGTTAQARAVNIGTGGALQTVVVGSTNGASTLTLNSGTGAINIGTSIAKTITIGNATGVTAVDIDSGSGGINLDGAVTILGANTFASGTGTSTFNSTLINLAGNSTVIDMTGTGTLGLNTTTNRAITTGTGLLTSGGALAVNGNFTASANVLTPKGTDYVTTGSQNNVSFGSGSLFRYAGVGTATFTGIAGGADGRFIRIMNASSSDITFTNQDLSSTDVNRIITGTGANVVISSGISVGFQYDSGASRWRMVVLPANSTTVGAFAYIQSGNAFGATAVLGTTDANLLNVITAGATRFSFDSASSTLTGQGATILTSTAGLSLTSAAASALSITSGTTGALTLDSGTTGDVNLGTGTGAKNIALGGTGANIITIGNTQTGGSVTLGNAMTTGTITIGGTAQTGTITLGSSSGTNTLNIAGGSGATTLNLANVQTGGAISLGAGMTTGTIQIGGTGAQTGTITIGGGTGAQTVNLATGSTGVKTVHIADGTAANIITIGTGQTAGSIALGSAMTTGTIDIGNSSGAMTGTINIGGSTGAQTLSFGGGSVGIKTINIGTGTAANVISIGTGQTGGSFTVGTAMTNGTITIGGTSQTGIITLGSSDSSNTLNIAGGTGATTLSLANAQTAGAVNIGAAMTTGTITIGGTGAQTGTISIGTGTGAQALNFGTGGTGAKTVTLGSTASTGATNIQSGTGNINFTAGPTSSTSRVVIGNSATTTPDLLVLDNGTADPTGTNGATYYNTSTNKFRCYQNSAWTNCIGGDKIFMSKSSDQSVISSTTLVDDTDLQFSIAAGESWVVKYDLVTTNSSNSGPDWKSAVLAPTGSTCSFQLSGSEGAGAIFPQAITSDCTTPGTLVNSNVQDDLGLGFNVSMQGIVTAGVTAGTVKLQWSQNTSTAVNLTVKAGSVAQAFKIGGADLAEAYRSNDLTIQPGDVVSLDDTLENGVKKSFGPYDSSVAGIVSTRPGMVLGDSAGGSVLVALSGRVPVKVSNENGTIKAGDYLTTSTTPGVAMKATKAGSIIGTAMVGYDGGGIGLIPVFIKNGVSNGVGIADLISTQNNLVENFSQQILTNLMSISQQTGSSEVTTDRVTAVKEVITPKLITDTIEVKKFVNTLGMIFQNAVEFLGKVIFHTDVSFLGHLIFGKDSAGHAYVKAGGQEVEIKFENAYKNTPVINLNVYLTGGVTIDQIPQYAVYDLSQNGFKIKLIRPAGFDLDFGWVAVEADGRVSGEATSVQPESPTPTPGVIPEPSPSIEPTPTSTPTPSPIEISTPSPTAATVEVVPDASPTPTPLSTAF